MITNIGKIGRGCDADNVNFTCQVEVPPKNRTLGVGKKGILQTLYKKKNNNTQTKTGVTFATPAFCNYFSLIIPFR